MFKGMEMVMVILISMIFLHLMIVSKRGMEVLLNQVQSALMLLILIVMEISI